ncbi:MAG: hypothetical protein K0R05_2480 [Anaerocolumna sp.]|jgi:glycosyltransferase involved in cell wall biosynthesis|nr:hypothetical protein [Anaerocolumna sp.]
MKKIVFVAHEYGHYKGHGGIASYLYQLTSYIVKNCPNYFVYVITPCFDKNCDLLQYKNFSLYKINNENLHQQGVEVLNVLKKIKPDMVEVAEFLGMCLESLIYRMENKNEFKNTVFIVDNHTASRECYEWSTKLPVSLAPNHIKEAYIREKMQMILADLNISPSTFLSDYVKKRYKLNNVTTIPHPINLNFSPKDELLNEIKNKYDLSYYQNKFIISCITRIEGRKNQKGLIESFIGFLNSTKANALLILAGNSAINSINGLDEREELYSNIPEEHKSKIKFYDFLDKDGKDLIYQISNLSIIASTYENFPVAMTESIYQGVPVMASKFSGCYDFMSGCEDKTSFDPFDKFDLTKKITLFYNLNQNEQQDISKIQLDNILKLCAVENSVYNKLHLYQDILKKRKELNLTNNKSSLMYIADNDLRGIVKEEGIVNIVLYNHTDLRNLKLYINNTYPMLDNTDKQGVTAIGNYEIDYEVVGALINNKIIIIKNVSLDKNVLGKSWYNIIAGILLQREENYTYLPTNLDLNGINNIKELHNSMYKLIIDEMFYLKYCLKLEECYEK